MKNAKNPKTFISWGLGTQSTALCVMSTLGDFGIKKVDHIITSDTLFEHSYTYKIKEFYLNWLLDQGMDVHTVNNGSAEEIGEHNNLPLWTEHGAPLRRQCTGYFKIDPVRKKMRELLGISLSNTGRTKKGAAILYLGITYDEAERMSDSNRQYIINEYPLVDLRLTREDCINYLKDKGLPVPFKSCCIHCPYQGAKQWQFVKENYPEDFQQAVDYDYKIRIPTDSMLKRGLYSGELFIWKGSQPLEDVDFNQLVEDKLDICDSGYCFI